MVSSSKKWSITLSTVVALCLLFLGLFWGSPVAGAMQTLVWSDNFNDGTYEPEWTVSEGSFSTTTLRMESGTDVWNYASRTSTVAEGEWHFTVCIDSTAGACVAFMVTSIGGEGVSYPSTGYLVMFNPNDGWIRLYRHQSGRHSMGSYSVTISMGTVFDVIVTRDSSGNFNVLIDGIQRISAQSTHFDTSSYFAIKFCEGGYIDDIEVYDEIFSVNGTTTTPTTATDGTTNTGLRLPPLPIEVIGIGITVVAIIILIVGLILLLRPKKVGS
ncbi:hypothetical protein E2P64_08625 [Candidatus Bathyarchaeota archaeon]|nr:hypothetical protein E2P64_08625 [Candidatus Bathyarchaeota archaeon]